MFKQQINASMKESVAAASQTDELRLRTDKPKPCAQKSVPRNINIDTAECVGAAREGLFLKNTF
jgi:hypothetical protein